MLMKKEGLELTHSGLGVVWTKELHCRMDIFHTETLLPCMIQSHLLYIFSELGPAENAKFISNWSTSDNTM